MEQIKPIITGKRVHTITADGEYRLGGPGQFFSVIWKAADILPAGTITLEFDQDPGTDPAGAVIDLGATGSTGSRAIAANMVLPLIDVRVEGLPQGGEFDFYIM